MQKYAYTLVVGILIGGVAIYYLYPRIEHKVETKTETVTKLDVRTVTKTVQKPDGTKIIEQIVTDNSKIKQKEEIKVEKASQRNYILTVSSGTRLDNFEPVWGLQAQKRIFSHIYGGLYGRTDGEFGLSISINF